VGGAPHSQYSNAWDNGFQGNYWSNYTGKDNDGDGIGDTPHLIDENNQDNFPLMKVYAQKGPMPPKDDDDKLAPIDKFLKQYGVFTALGLLSVIVVTLSLYWHYSKRN